MDKEKLEILYHEARKESTEDTFIIQKFKFQELLTGLIIKCLNIKIGEYKKAKADISVKLQLKPTDAKAEKQLQILYSMENFLELWTYKNCIFHFQSKTITAQDRQIIKLEQEKQDLLDENNKLKKNIK